ncbi:glucosamine-fructose-6-phosphate aminotransferase [Paenibacillus mucilaginosus 3016]|uniref:Glutamine--fructose-6-phosphate aminotransferase [isomerizing] n=2 Tax=Paenibacillus mucilaginosus TaxID=61624 RepID=H6NCM6_9BACL|nr:SIS domain-containing protein [Paenibacillus mucilaginosus]AFC28955.1 glucosamine-fructose-6-phosphate aminotransferase [Paenibacillus mucilaginosus 3016]WFA17705.1 SIS domain-containing protein [Paenibacillus mucilaginosus]
MRNFIDDVKDQPEALGRLAEYYATREGGELLARVTELSGRKYDRILFTGMGSSYAASRLAATYLWSRGIPAIHVEASELLHYGAGTLLTNALLFFISQSGESVEIRQLLDILPADAVVIGITNVKTSTLAVKSALVLPLLAGEESTTSSKTYTSTLAVTLLACQALAKQPAADGIAAIQAAGERLFTLESHAAALDWNRITEWLRTADSIYLIGRGPAVSTAIQGALTFKELVKVQAESMEAATFRHGPLETVNEQTLIFAVASPGKTSALVDSFTMELTRCGAKVITIHEGIARIAKDEYAEAQEEHTAALDEYFAALVDIYPIQLAANLLAERLERNGGFQWITKVTTKE